MLKKLLALLLMLGWVLPISPVRAEESARIQNDSSFVLPAPDYGYTVVGEVLNTGDQPLWQIVVDATFRDSRGDIVSVGQGGVITHYLPPKAKAPFRLVEWNATRINRIASYTLTLTFLVRGNVPRVPVRKLELLEVSSRITADGRFETSGKVKNDGDTASNGTLVVGTFYDSGGKVVYMDYACVPGPANCLVYPPPPGIPPGATLSFQLTVPYPEVSQRIATFALFAESEQYTSLPELPYPIIIATIALTLVIFTSRRATAPGRTPQRPCLDKSAKFGFCPPS